MSEGKKVSLESVMSELSALENADLLDVYELLVKVEHYDPVATPPAAEMLMTAGVRSEMVRKLVFSRMS